MESMGQLLIPIWTYARAALLIISRAKEAGFWVVGSDVLNVSQPIWVSTHIKQL